MLVIRRRAGESLFIGEGAEIKVLEIGPSQVKLGIEAPREITVLRNEVRDANLAAARQTSPGSVEDLLKKLRR